MSCEGYRKVGVTMSGFYEIDPDGTHIGEVPIMAYCNFSEG